VATERRPAEHPSGRLDPVDALDINPHVLGEDIGSAAGYRHRQLRSWSRPARATYRTERLLTGTAPPPPPLVSN